MRKRIGLSEKELAVIIKSLEFLMGGSQLLYTGEEYEVVVPLLHRLKGGRIHKKKESKPKKILEL